MEAMRIVMSGMWLQDAGSISSGNSRLLMWFVGMVAFAMVVQAIAVIVMAIGAAKAQQARRWRLRTSCETKTDAGPRCDAERIFTMRRRR